MTGRASRGARGGAGGVAAIAMLVAAVVAASFVHEAALVEELAGPARAIDGDTLDIGGVRVRLAGIDAPEIDQVCVLDGQEHACGKAARDRLAALAGEHIVTCSGHRRDRHGRLVAGCMADGVDLGGAMVRQGWAVAFGAHRDAEAAAREEGAGLWAGRFDSPQSWRRVNGHADEDAVSPWAWPLADWLLQAFGHR